MTCRVLNCTLTVVDFKENETREGLNHNLLIREGRGHQVIQQ